MDKILKKALKAKKKSQNKNIKRLIDFIQDNGLSENSDEEDSKKRKANSNSE